MVHSLHDISRRWMRLGKCGKINHVRSMWYDFKEGSDYTGKRRMRKALRREPASEVSLEECCRFETWREQAHWHPRQRTGAGNSRDRVKSVVSNWSGQLRPRRTGEQRRNKLYLHILVTRGHPGSCQHYEGSRGLSSRF